MKSYIRLFCGVSTAALLLSAELVQAQITPPSTPPESAGSAAQSASTGLEDIVVTARRRAEDVQRVPIAVTVVNTEGLVQNSITRAQDLTRITPGLEVNPDRGTQRSAGSFAIRGQSGSPFAGGSGVAVYFAEVPTIFNIDLTDLENVQVLKGPQGTLFGRVTTGGAVLLTPKGPTSDFEGSIRARYGQYGTRLVEFGVGGPLIGDVLGVRIAGQLRGSDGFTRNLTTNKRVDDYDSDTFRLSLRLQPVDWIQNDTIVNVRTWAESNGSRQPEIVQPFGTVNATSRVTTGTIRPIPASVAAASGVACPGGICPTWLSVAQQQLATLQQLGRSFSFDSSNVDPPRQRDLAIINTTRFDVADNVSLKNIISYGRIKLLSDGDTGSDATVLPIHEGYQPAGSLINTSFGDRIFTEELQAQAGLFEDRLQLTVGGYYERTWAENFSRTLSGFWAGFGSSVPTPAAGAAAAQVAAYSSCLATAYSEVNSGYCHSYTGQAIITNKPRNSDKALYAQAEIKLTDKLRLTGGIRQTWSSRKSTSGRLNSYPDGVTNTGSAVRLTGIPTYQVTIRNNPIAFAFPTPSSSLPGASLLVQQDKFKRATWMAAADYTVSDRLFLYGTVRTGYKAGGFNASGVPAAFSQFGPESVTDYEVGVKGQWEFAGIRGRSSIALFWDDYKDIQRTITVNLGTVTTTVTTNAAAATIKGIEFDNTIRLNDWLDLRGFYAFTDAGYNSWLNTGQFASNGVPASADLTSNLLSNTSRHRWALQPTLRVPGLAQNVGELSLTANVNYQGRHAVTDLNGPFAPANTVRGVTRADLRADLRKIGGSEFAVAAGVTNLTNKRNKIGVVDLRTSEGISVQQFAEPRMWYVEGSIHF